LKLIVNCSVRVNLLGELIYDPFRGLDPIQSNGRVNGAPTRATTIKDRRFACPGAGGSVGFW
jgi:hypothetical protein